MHSFFVLLPLRQKIKSLSKSTNMKEFDKYTASIVKCKNKGGIILPRVQHGSAILEF